MKQPHDNWSTFYDMVYEKTHGNTYSNLTTETVGIINDIITNGTIIDYGAGTGRLTIPLKMKGYEIIAVEKSSGMVQELEKKRNNLNLDFQIYNCPISEYKNGNSDLALALFTVLSYATTETELSKNIETICKHLNPDGYFLFDLPYLGLFKSPPKDSQPPDFNRSVTLTATIQKNIYIYHEKCSGLFNGQAFNYEDEFQIRYWEPETLDKLLSLNNLKPTDTDYSQFNYSGSTYKLYRKI